MWHIWSACWWWTDWLLSLSASATHKSTSRSGVRRGGAAVPVATMPPQLVRWQSPKRWRYSSSLTSPAGRQSPSLGWPQSPVTHSLTSLAPRSCLFSSTLSTPVRIPTCTRYLRPSTGRTSPCCWQGNCENREVILLPSYDSNILNWRHYSFAWHRVYNYLYWSLHSGPFVTLIRLQILFAVHVGVTSLMILRGDGAQSRRWASPPLGATTPSQPRPPDCRGFIMITLRRTTLDRTPLDEWSAPRRDLYLTTHNTHKELTCMPTAGFEPTSQKAMAADQCLRPRGYYGSADDRY